MISIRWFAAIVLLTVTAYLFPLFHIHKLDEIVRKRKMETFNPKTFSQEFWNNHLLPSREKAVSVEKLIPLIKTNPEKAKTEFSNTVGIGSVYYYYLRGSGYVKSIEKDHVTIVLQKDSSKPDVRIQTGKIFGNAIRNGCNLLNVSDFPNSQEFNQISMQLNQIVENEVLPPFNQNVSIGDGVHFVGCCEVLDEKTDLHPLNLVPIFLEIEESF